MTTTDAASPPLDLPSLMAGLGDGSVSPADLVPLMKSVMRQMSEDPDNDPRIRAAALQMQAIEHQNQASVLLAEADRLEHEAVLKAEAERADALLAAAEAEAAGLAEAVRGAVEREREAADRLADAVDHARRAADTVEELALAEAAPAAQTDAMVRQEKAERVAAQFRATAERATAERNHAELVLAQAREVIRQGKVRAKAARGLADRASDTVRPSLMTLTLDWQKLVTGGRLADGELAFVRTLVQGFAQATGADKNIAAAAYQRAKGENREEFNRALALLPAPQTANVLPPGVVPGAAVAR